MTMTIEISEKPVSEAFKKLSWKMLEEHLAETALTQEDVDKLVGLLRRSDPLVLKRSNPSRQTRRDELLDKLADHLDSNGHAPQAAEVRSHSARLAEIDGVYQAILDMLAMTDAAAFPSELRVSALLDRSNREYVDLLKRSYETSTAEGYLDLRRVTIKVEDGKAVNPEGVHEALLTSLASTLSMEAHVNGWYDATDVLVLPALPTTTEKEQFKVGSVQLLAVAWRHWQFSERRCRYLDAPLVRTEDLAPDWVNRGVKTVWLSRPSDDNLELYDHVAHARLGERLTQEWSRVLTDPRYKEMVYGTEGEVALLPHQSVSLEELHGALALSQLLSSKITEDQSEYAGLTLSEWVRGYSVLQDIARKALETRDPNRLTIRFSNADLVKLLQRLGLQGGKAQVFIGYATYQKASRDLFDQPLVKMLDGSYLLLAIASASSSIPTVLLSTLGMLKVNLDGRGKRFEKSMIELLGRHGIKARTITCDRDGETYDYDVAFVWGDYLFLFECKSRGLGGGDPARTYFFSLGIREVIKQVRRLAEGLERHPDILETYMPEAVGKKVVHCVVNSLPYATFSGEHEIHFADEGGIARFFQQSEIGPRSISRESGLGAIDPAAAEVFLWDGTQPTPEDFLRHLQKPFQLVNAVAHLEPLPVVIPVGNGVVLRMLDFLRTDMSSVSMREAARKAGYRTGIAPNFGPP